MKCNKYVWFKITIVIVFLVKPMIVSTTVGSNKFKKLSSMVLISNTERKVFLKI